jgi:hypothetical protein
VSTLWLMALLAHPAAAHRLDPAVLELASAGEAYRVRWSPPAGVEGMAPVFPCPVVDGLLPCRAGPIGVSGLDETPAILVVREGGQVRTRSLTPAHPIVQLEGQPEPADPMNLAGLGALAAACGLGGGRRGLAGLAALAFGAACAALFPVSLPLQAAGLVIVVRAALVQRGSWVGLCGLAGVLGALGPGYAAVELGAAGVLGGVAVWLAPRMGARWPLGVVLGGFGLLWWGRSMAYDWGWM